MAVNTFVAFSIVVLTYFHLQPCRAAKIEITRQSLGSTSPVTVTCTAQNSSQTIQRVKLIRLTTGNGETIMVVKANGHYELLPPYNHSNNFIPESAVFGQNQVEQSYLKLTIKKPSPDLSSTYTCTVYSIGANGLFHQDVDADYLNVIDPRIHELKSKLESLKNELSKQRKEIGIIKNKASMVAFTAGKTIDGAALKAKKNVIFDLVTLNVGNAFNQQDGTFTAPDDGDYVFHLSAKTICWGCGLEVHLTKEGAQTMDFVNIGGDSNVDRDSITRVMRLTSGEKVRVYTSSAIGLLVTLGAGSEVSFSGYSIPSI